MGQKELWPLGVRRLLRDPELFSRHVIGRALRPYQLEALRAILDSILGRKGLTFTVMMARQMGKNELSAHLECYLLNLFRRRGGVIIKAAPTFRPQLLLSRLRLLEVLDNPWNRGRYRLRSGNLFELERARLLLLSGAPTANVVGATASILLEIDEAQDFLPAKYDRDFRPMGATANVTTVLYGTAWAEDSLLEREKQRNLEEERQDGLRRHFQYDWRALAALLPEYEQYVSQERERLGQMHPLFLTQYELQPLHDGGRLFSAEQRLLLQGEHERQEEPSPGCRYVAGIDLGGFSLAAESEPGQNADQAVRRLEPWRDSTVITIAAIEGGPQPLLRVVQHYWWTGRSHRQMHEQMLALLRRWGVCRAAVDATGLGAGLAEFLKAALGERILPVTFTPARKSQLGYALLAAVNCGRLQLYRQDGSAECQEFWRQARAARASVRPNRSLSFFVPAEEGHDDFLSSLALCVAAGNEQVPPPAAGVMLAAEDILAEIDRGRF
jgi:hypothetical protein